MTVRHRPSVFTLSVTMRCWSASVAIQALRIGPQVTIRAVVTAVLIKAVPVARREQARVERLNLPEGEGMTYSEINREVLRRGYISAPKKLDEKNRACVLRLRERRTESRGRRCSGTVPAQGDREGLRLDEPARRQPNDG